MDNTNWSNISSLCSALKDQIDDKELRKEFISTLNFFLRLIKIITFVLIITIMVIAKLWLTLKNFVFTFKQKNQQTIDTLIKQTNGNYNRFVDSTRDVFSGAKENREGKLQIDRGSGRFFRLLNNWTKSTSNTNP